MSRSDISNYLIHWTKGESYQDAFDTLYSIVMEGKLLGGTGNIKGQYTCVCFSESPKSSFHEVSGKYKPFGIEISKKYLFELGGRPVIYQSEPEFYELPDSLKWRHVRYEPNSDTPKDFSWEREWRINVDELVVSAENSRIIVPDDSWIQLLEKDYNDRAYWEATDWDYNLMYEPETFKWKYTKVDV